MFEIIVVYLTSSKYGGPKLWESLAPRVHFVQPNIGSWKRPVCVLTCPNKCLVYYLTCSNIQQLVTWIPDTLASTFCLSQLSKGQPNQVAFSLRKLYKNEAIMSAFQIYLRKPKPFDGWTCFYHWNTVGIWNLTIWNPETFEIRTFWRSNFKWSLCSRISNGPDHLKTGKKLFLV